MKNTSLSTAVEELTEQLAAVQSRSQQSHLRVNELEDENEKLALENKSLKSKTEELSNLSTLESQLSAQIALTKSLESKLHIITPELTSLRESHKKFKFIQEEKTLLEARLKLMEDLRRQVADAELEAANLRQESARWAAFMETEDAFHSPEDVMRALNNERAERLALLDKVGRLEAELAAREAGLEGDARELADIESQVTSLQETIARNAKAMARLERQKALAAKESEFLREQLKSFDTEETVFMQGNFDAQKNKRIENLEKLLAEEKEEIDRLTTELAAFDKKDKQASDTSTPRKRARSQEDGVEHDERIGELLRRNRQLQDDYTKLVKNEETAKNEIRQLQNKLKTLESTAAVQSRVLQLRDNPAARDQAIKKSMLDALRAENNSLLAQLENRREDIGQVVSINTLDRVKLEIKEMEREVAEKEKRIRRMKEIWSAKSVEFREAVYSLLGYKLDFLANNKVRATSMFASSDDESFTFDPAAGTMKMGGRPDSPFAQECANLITFWVQERREIPCFLAALNLELYDKTTKAARF
ncbi:spindle assembly checkpoint component Mad1 [Myxozyma melibiosi]|uniref:Spindle assembly checkpoint component MAD1 n=1 Tax=Myxozyma melibiosi TaxID=54550 RepID=A0ABR1FA04_9ASCO